MFVFIELDQLDPELRGVERLKKAVGHVGASITMTTLTNLVAFAVTASTVVPAIRLFCIYAAVALLFCYSLVMTFLLVFISFDVKRIESGRWDILPCKQKLQYIPWKQSTESLSGKVYFLF